MIRSVMEVLRAMLADLRSTSSLAPELAFPALSSLEPAITSVSASFVNRTLVQLG